jgi:perosamine synthetase
MLTPHPSLRRADVFRHCSNDLRAFSGGNNLYLTYNARGALYQLLQSLPNAKGNVVLLPAFHCTALVEPVAHSRFRGVFYRIKQDLSIDLEDLRAKATPGVAIIVAVHFFGIPVDLRPVLELRARLGCYVLEDCAHSFLTLDDGRYIGHRSDFAIFSFYKTVASLVGGGLRNNLEQFDFHPSKSTVPLKESAVIAKRLFEQLIENSPDGFLRRGYQYLESRRVSRQRTKSTLAEPAASSFIDDPYLFREDLARAEMPALCRRILKSSDWQGIIAARRRNYELLGRTLRENALLRKLRPKLPDGACPWAYPVLLRNRARFEHQLRDRGVPLFTFGEVLHPLLEGTDPATRTDAEDLSRQLMLLPVHQNLSAEDVARYADEINRFLGGIEQTSAELDSAIAAPEPVDLRGCQ